MSCLKVQQIQFQRHKMKMYEIEFNILFHKCCYVIRFALNSNSFGFRDLNAHILLFAYEM